MPIKTDGQERRSIALEFELPGTPDQVWRAIATGPGISSWFVPSEVEERQGGAVAFHLGPGLESTGEVTAFEPPRCFAYVEPGWSETAPPLGTEFVIEARAGGTCVVRLVHSLFTTQSDWDDELGSMETGWPPFFEVLKLYLTHFAGQPGTSIRPTGQHAGSDAEAWALLTGKLNLADAALGQRRAAPAETAPPLAGTVERISEGGNHRELTLRLDQPAPGLAMVGAYSWGGITRAAVSLYFYGDDALAVAARQEPVWDDWMAEHFKTPPAAGKTG
ncbi:SRPBCC family protein [Phreatobacter stygius]|uniref:SRPBCC domain-containing protein n=1 Tax=Phreatobacter stygius TaxID=1940610 RepID=A0A4D7B9R8_9HYPH|nr:SRPBCC domain-containing protein [Phreatobacter stygius]QCI67320.1 SRPBCC domain-containing protein [Phreatobacter stygius]